MIDYKSKYLKYKLKYVNFKKGGTNHIVPDILESILVDTLGTDSVMVLFLNFLCIDKGIEPKYKSDNVKLEVPKITRRNNNSWEGIAPQRLRGSTTVHWQAHFNNETLDSTKGEYKIQIPGSHNFCQCYAPYLCVNKSRGIFNLLQDDDDQHNATENIQKMANLLINFLINYILINNDYKIEFLNAYRDIMVEYENDNTPYITQFLDDYENKKDLEKYIYDCIHLLNDLENNVNHKAEILANNK